MKILDSNTRKEIVFYDLHYIYTVFYNLTIYTYAEISQGKIR